ncbi:MAG: hypothetical protein ACM30H_14725 [Clostridia bacterium]
MKNILLLLVAAFVLSACGERQQVIEQSSEKRYQGKRDGKPWENDPLAYRGMSASPTWSKGDRVSWENQIKARQNGQNEDKRIYQ